MNDYSPSDYPQAPQASYGASTPTGGPNPSGGYYGTMPPQGSYRPPLPSRALPVTLLVGGLVLSLIVAPIVFLSMIFAQSSSALNFSTSSTGHYVKSVTVEDSGTFDVQALDNGATLTCTLKSGDKEYPLGKTPGSSDSVTGRDIVPGTYTLTCDGTNAEVIVYGSELSDKVAGEVLRGSLLALGISTLLGIVGIVLFIVGIVRVVSVNGKRREIKYGSQYR